MTPPQRPNETTAPSTVQLRLIETRLQRLEDGLGMLCREVDGEVAGKAASALQEVDILLQSASALATFLDAAARDRQGESAQADAALATMPLRDMARRLAGHRHRSVETGVPELF